MELIFDISDGLFALLGLNIITFGYFYWKGRKLMSALSNLKDAVQMLDNTAQAASGDISVHISRISNLVPEAEVQVAADKVNAIALSIQEAIKQLKATA